MRLQRALQAAKLKDELGDWTGRGERAVRENFYTRQRARYLTAHAAPVPQSTLLALAVRNTLSYLIPMPMHAWLRYSYRPLAWSQTNEILAQGGDPSLLSAGFHRSNRRNVFADITSAFSEFAQDVTYVHQHAGVTAIAHGH